MIIFLLRKYREIGWDASKWKKKKRIFRYNMGYDLNKLLILNWIIGRLNVAGHKSRSFFILMHTLGFLKNKSKIEPILMLINLLNSIKQNVLLFNKKKGSVIFELPRFLTIEQSIKKIIDWLIKAVRKNKENVIESFIKEINNLLNKSGDVFTKKEYIKATIKKNKPFFYLLKKKKRR